MPSVNIDWPSVVQIIQGISAVLLAYIAYLQVKNGKAAIVIGQQAGAAATSAQDSAIAAQGVAAAVASTAQKQDATMTEIVKQNGHIVKLVNSASSLLRTEIQQLRAQLEEHGIVPHAPPPEPPGATDPSPET